MTKLLVSRRIKKCFRRKRNNLVGNSLVGYKMIFFSFLTNKNVFVANLVEPWIVSYVLDVYLLSDLEQAGN